MGSLSIVKDIWKSFWENYSISDDDFKLIKYRKILLDELKNEISCLGKGHVRILNAGCGIDPVPIHFLKEHDNLKFFLLDISPDCLDINRSFFEKKLSGRNLGKIKLVQGDVFDLKFPDKYFDIIYNTGVLEHFHEEEQILMLSEFERTLKEGGVFITLNPSKKGKLYTYMKNYFEKKGKWEYGPEYPLKSLKKSVKESFKEYDIMESNLDFQDSAHFLKRHDNKLIQLIGTILGALSRWDTFEKIFLKIFGGYILLTKVRKK